MDVALSAATGLAAARPARNAAGASYEDGAVRMFTLAAVVWGVVGMLVGVLIAAQLAWPELNFGIPWLSYGRLRPLHTNAVIFAFGGCALFATSLLRRAAHLPGAAVPADSSRRSRSGAGRRSSSRRRSRCRWASRSGKEYAELEWPIDILIARRLGRLRGRVLRHASASARCAHIYVANWFFGAFILTVALLHIVNSAAIPVEL